MGRMLFFIGLCIALIGVLLMLLDKAGLNPGHLSGDIRIHRQNFSCFMPITTMILISVLLTIIANIITRIINRP